ncbi:prephenate dehydratase [Thalassoglobus polymorphus]|uniref:Bifunctional chorismate mutase/prephenate dehydratase n=1 Tax=Thalassoglobus polymorphus TaxID=2527994 RepID=A0A517QQY4_9PLAN|nr:prephenate dehydratase [Thalassoglobus polymorphus]QDT34044.1 Prephenate dehydratase [Thalassoglobus polymorphus]
MAKKKTTRPSSSTPTKKAAKAKPATKPRRVNPAVRLKSIDKEIVKLLNERLKLTIGELEQLTDRREVWFDPQLERELWEQLASYNKGPIDQEVLKSIFREVLSSAREQVKEVRVAYLGPQFSFTHLAALEKFGKTADLIPVNSIAAVFEEVNKGHAEFGIVPIENSTDGRIVDTLDMFTRLPLRICGEVQIAVHHNLLSRSPRSEITEIYSKPQALSQCRDWLARNMPNAQLHDVTSTSTAAALAQSKPGAAAIASRQAAVQYGLDIVADSIEDNAYNVTRFAIIGDQDTKPTKRDRTALLLQIPHSPGSLTDALNAFKTNKINLTWIESFPLRGPETGYLFFLDFEGHSKDPKIKKALTSLEKKAVRLEVLGSYPRTDIAD